VKLNIKLLEKQGYRVITVFSATEGWHDSWLAWMKSRGNEVAYAYRGTEKCLMARRGGEG